MSDTSAQLSCSVGSAGFRLIDTSIKGDAVVDKDGVRTGTKYTVECDGEILGDDAAGFAANITAFHAALALIERRNFIITANGVTEFQLLAAQCIDHGPTVKSKSIDKQSSASVFVKPVKFTIEGSTAEGADSDTQSGTPTSVKITTATKPDEKRTINYAGKFSSAANDSEALFNAYLDALIARYPGTDWVESHKIGNTFSGRQLEFEISFKELATPIDILSQQFTIVDGELGAKSTSRDEQMRKVTTWTYDATLLAGSDPQAFITAVRAIVAQAIAPNRILRETFDTSPTQQIHAKAAFTVLEGADGSDLLDWEQSCEQDNPFGENRTPIVAFEFPGRQPLLVRGPQKVYVYVQQGRAVGVNRFPKPAQPILNPANLEWEGVVKLTRKNNIECETTWSYRFIYRDPAIFDAANLSRPSPDSTQWYD